jgi:nitrite reductase/ring-hydroxylating ferredoxin subunit/uncharacterized membrane protein
MTAAVLAEARTEEAPTLVVPSLNQIHPEEMLAEIPEYKPVAKKVSRGLHELVLKGGQPARFAADLLHGTWLGHPLHSVLTDLTIGAWTFGSLLDILSLRGGHRRGNARAADKLIALGTAAAIPTALTGIADYSTIPEGAVTTGATHGLINASALALYGLSLGLRKIGLRLPAMILSGLGLGLILVSSWLGGHLAYHYKVGVNRAEDPGKPKPWQAVVDDDKLPENKPLRVEVDEKPVLVYRHLGEIYAIGANCAHEAGPLDEGKFEGCQVECPWHQSVFDLRTGRVVHGPATNPEPVYKTRVKAGKVELRLKD